LETPRHAPHPSPLPASRGEGIGLALSRFFLGTTLSPFRPHFSGRPRPPLFLPPPPRSEPGRAPAWGRGVPLADVRAAPAVCGKRVDEGGLCPTESFAGEFGNPPRVPITTMQGERPRATRPSAAAGARSARGTPRPHAPRPRERSLTGPLPSPASAQSPSPAPAQPTAPARFPSQATDSPPWSRLARGSTWRPRCVGNSRR